MPWNDNAKPGPWGAPKPADDARGGDRGSGRPDRGREDTPNTGSANAGPWGKPPPAPVRPERTGGGGPKPGPGGTGGGGPRGPDIEELTRELNARLRRAFGSSDGRGIKPGAVGLAAAVLAGLWLSSGIYMVQPDQQAVVTRFGGYADTKGPGLRYHLPAPIERVEKVSVTSLKGLDIGGVQGAPVPEESLMLTGDENIVDLNFTVQWRIANASDYLFRVVDPEATVKMVAESAMREVVGKTDLQSIITNRRAQVQAEAADLMQRTLDSYGVGVSIVQVQVRAANPPAEVIPAFQDVNNANQDAESAVNEARTYRNRVINEAKGDAARITQAAEGYREQVALEAEGSAARFDQVYEQYKKAPAVTRQRLYLETMERVLARSNKVVLDAKGGVAPVVLPSDLLRSQGNAATQADAQAAGQPQQGQPPPAPPRTNGGGRPQ